jgi:hypothetical protein
MALTTTLVLVPTLMAGVASAQAPDTLWTRIYGHSNYDEGLSVRQTFDGGFIVSGYTEEDTIGRRHAWLLKTDANGDTAWSRIHGAGVWDEARCVLQTPDSGFVLAGYVSSPSIATDVLLVKTGPDGTANWTRTYGGVDVDEGNSLCRTRDGGYAITGRTESFAVHGGTDAWIIRTDAKGDTLWARAFGGQWSDEGYEICQTLDDGFAVTGYKTVSTSVNGPNTDVLLLKLDANGDSAWARLYEARPGEEYRDYGYALVRTADSGFMLVGETRYFDDPTWEVDLYAVRTDADGDTIWTRTFDMAGYNDVGRAVTQLEDGGFLIAGYTIVGPSGYDILLLRLDAGGDTLWTKMVGRPERDEAWSFDLTTDGGIIVAGRTDTFSTTRRDVWLVRLGPEDVGVAEPHAGTPKPIPSTAVVSGELPLNPVQGYRLYDVSGRQVRPENAGPGVYVVRAGTRLVGRVVKAR